MLNEETTKLQARITLIILAILVRELVTNFHESYSAGNQEGRNLLFLHECLFHKKIGSLIDSLSRPTPISVRSDWTKKDRAPSCPSPTCPWMAPGWTHQFLLFCVIAKLLFVYKYWATDHVLCVRIVQWRWVLFCYNRFTTCVRPAPASRPSFGGTVPLFYQMPRVPLTCKSRKWHAIFYTDEEQRSYFWTRTFFFRFDDFFSFCQPFFVSDFRFRFVDFFRFQTSFCRLIFVFPTFFSFYRHIFVFPRKKSRKNGRKSRQNDKNDVAWSHDNYVTFSK